MAAGEHCKLDDLYWWLLGSEGGGGNIAPSEVNIVQ